MGFAISADSDPWHDMVFFMRRAGLGTRFKQLIWRLFPQGEMLHLCCKRSQHRISSTPNSVFACLLGMGSFKMGLAITLCVAFCRMEVGVKKGEALPVPSKGFHKRMDGPSQSRRLNAGHVIDNDGMVSLA
jgi:hypothetical protein